VHFVARKCVVLLADFCVVYFTIYINTNNRGIALKRLIAMCNPRYLGNIIIKEFSNAYEWWNFLGEISEEARDMLNNQ
jgi:hypothetical protein